MKVGPWIDDPEGGAYRAIEGRDAGDPGNRVAFIEKTPRVRIRSKDIVHDGYNWAERPYKGTGPRDPESRVWCDMMLVMFGYELPVCDFPFMEVGHQATVYHAGTNAYYRAVVLHRMTPEEVNAENDAC